MRKLKLYIAISLNGKIAKSDGSVDWLEGIPNPDKLDYGYTEFYDSIETTIQGNSTYQQILDWGIDFPYKGKKNFVLTRNKQLTNNDDVEFVTSDHINFIKGLKRQEGKDIWLIGGGQINTMLINEGLIDEMLIFVMPIILDGGIELFGALPKETSLTLANSISYSTGVVELHYRLNN